MPRLTHTWVATCLGSTRIPEGPNLLDSAMHTQSEWPAPAPQVQCARPYLPLSVTQIGKVANQIVEGNVDVVAAYLYGSTMRTDRNGTSDIDLLVVSTDTAQLTALETLARRLADAIPGADVTVLREGEVADGIHPGWSRHYYTNVHRGGTMLCGPNVVAAAAATPTTFADAYRRIVQLCQRTRLVLINPTKRGEAAFWLAKYQHWGPLCLMELLDLAGCPHDELHQAHDAFAARFPTAPRTGYPYSDLTELQLFLEAMTKWLREQAMLFGSKV